jgi:hypothetical protein
MLHSPSAPSRALKSALGIGAAAVASLAFAGVASADVIVVTPTSVGGTPSTDPITTAITQANGNAASSNTITLAPGTYNPAHQPIVITKSLNIAADHSFQTSMGVGPQIEINGGTAAAASVNDLLQVKNNAALRMDGFNLDAAGGAGFASVAVSPGSNLTTYGVTMDGTPGAAVSVAANASATLNETTINGPSSTGPGIANAGTLTLKNVTMWGGAGPAINNQGTMSLLNTLLANNGPGPGPECTGTAATVGTGSLDAEDTLCGTQFHTTAPTSTVDAQAPLSDDGNGGPATTILFPTNADMTNNKGTNCPTTDGRFFANPSGPCDIGAVNSTATRETAAPTCSVTSTAADHSSQQVTLGDSASGIGPEVGLGTDNPSNTPATAYPPPAAVPVFGSAVSNLQISNGTVAFTSPTAPTLSGLVLTATKTTSGTSTRWSFTGLNWAGVSKNCF